MSLGIFIEVIHTIVNFRYF
ncbi:hypothetical protein F383_34132 [Gossypium arboreum]|uniref:Uncharacterized protein n=1 Tax=Gossypium arboreum TaxID=29729 RepID=A0A0B0N4B5_GOSAR|nr:hypothetical protein F383_34132 [Gossypium arboreum]